MLLQWTVCSGIAWHAISSPIFRRYVQLLSPTYSPPGTLQLQAASSVCRFAFPQIHNMLRAPCLHPSSETHRSAAGEYKLRNSLLLEEFASVQQADHLSRSTESNMTVSVDGRSNQRMESLFGAVLQLPNNTVQFLHLIDISHDHHTTEHICAAHLPLLMYQMHWDSYVSACQHAQVHTKLQHDRTECRVCCAPQAYSWTSSTK